MFHTREKRESGTVKIDHTSKMYVGGAQKRPDGNHQRTIYGKNKQIVGSVGEANRKDVRGAVRCYMRLVLMRILFRTCSNVK
jgi:hypothetical protein